MHNFKPEGYNSVAPYLVIHDADKLIEFVERVFGGRMVRRFDRPDGKIQHAEIKLHDSIIMFAEANEHYPPMTAFLHVYVADVDEVYHRALEFGCKGLEEPVQKDGEDDKRGMFKDFAGNMWSVTTQRS